MKPMRRAILVALGSLCLIGGVCAKPWWMRGVESNEGDFLDPDVAFRVSSHIDGNQVRIRWVIADGYYLYRQRMSIQAESPDLEVSGTDFPHGKARTDPYFGTQEIYTQQVEATAGYTRTDAGAHPIQLKVTYQGCAEAGLCYPPIVKVIFPDRKPTGGPRATVAAGGSHPEATNPWSACAILGGGLAFFLAGLLLRKGRRLDMPA